MLSRRALVVALLLSVAAILAVAASGATGADVVSHGETDVIQLQPHANAEGTYASINDDGDVQIHIDGTGMGAEGVPLSTVSDFGPVVTVENVLDTSEDSTLVWISHESDYVTFYDAKTGDSMEGGPQEPPEDAIELSPGESVAVSLSVNTRDTDTIDIGTFSVLTAIDNSPFTTAGGGSSSSSSTSETPAPTPGSTPEPVEPPEQEPEETTPDGQLEEEETPVREETSGDDDGLQAVEIAGFSLETFLPLVSILTGATLLVALLRRRDNVPGK